MKCIRSDLNTCQESVFDIKQCNTILNFAHFLASTVFTLSVFESTQIKKHNFHNHWPQEPLRLQLCVGTDEGAMFPCTSQSFSSLRTELNHVG